MNPLYTMIVRAMLSVIFVGFYGWITLAVLSREAELVDGVKEAVLLLLGALTSIVIRVISFWFDSSQGSSDKTAALAEAARPK